MGSHTTRGFSRLIHRRKGLFCQELTESSRGRGQDHILVIGSDMPLWTLNPPHRPKKTDVLFSDYE